MKLSPYMDINRIEFMLTYQCSGKCIHCSVGEKINRSNYETHVNEKYATKAITELAKHYNITSVMTFGGEPLLYSDATCKIHQSSTEGGIQKRQIISNGYFTKDIEKQKLVAENLYNSGVNNFLLSVDAFHQKDIPLDNVKSFLECIIETKMEGVKLSPSWVVNKDLPNEYNEKTNAILDELSVYNIPVSSGNDIFLSGRAKENLSQFYDNPSLDLSQKCGEMIYTDPLDHVQSITIEPDGSVSICGFIIGNIYKESIVDICKRYNPYENKYMSALMENGVSELLKTANEQDNIAINLDEFYSSCDVCHGIMDKVNSK